MSDQMMVNRMLNILKEKAAMGMGVSAGARRRSSSCPVRRRCATGTRKKCVRAGDEDEFIDMIGEGRKKGVKTGPSVASKKAAKKNPWIDFIKAYAKKNKLTYGEALQDAKNGALHDMYCEYASSYKPWRGRLHTCKSGSKTSKKKIATSKTAKKKTVGSKKCKKGQKLATISYKRKSGKKIGPFKKCVKAKGRGFDFIDYD